jgi:hypothetical protein
MVIISTNAAEVSIQAVSPLSIFGAGAAAEGAAGAGAGASTFGGSEPPAGGKASPAKDKPVIKNIESAPSNDTKAVRYVPRFIFPPLFLL